MINTLLTTLKKNRLLSLSLLAGLLICVSLVFYYINQKQSSSPDMINVKDYGAKGDNLHDDTEAIQKTFNMAKSNKGRIKITIPKGTYKLTKTLRIYKNTHLSLQNGATLMRHHNATILVNGDPGKMYHKYNGNGQITIDGGIWDANITQFPDPANVIGLGRGENIRIKNIEVRDVPSGHAIDLNAVKNVVIENSKFLGYKDTTPNHSRYYAEAIQISEHTKLGFSPFGDYDGTPSKNISIRHCYFGKSGTEGTGAWPVAVGNHGSVYNKFSTNISIHHNTFKELTFVAVRIFKWKDTYIYDNQFQNNNRGVALSNPDGKGEPSKTAEGIQTGLPQSGSHTTIKNNYFHNTLRENIFGQGWPSSDSIAKIESLDIQNNTFYNQKGVNKRPNLYLGWVDDVTISNNHFSKIYLGMYLTFASNVKITGNTLDTVATHALLVTEPDPSYQLKGNTHTIEATDNKISNFKGIGLFLQYTKGFSLTNNTFHSPGNDNYINVRLHSSNGSIHSNQVN
ncbi:right-handed parallel beta-helix repeat-containing protein [Fictibacillus sp. S7]|uniref:right-handed parallel beta-helix repeat-containing protein n=1 Tax=Fictibacillus sp. S7 TaxID=2212476 RepID=UPI0010135E71|nr:right-handed parallel beta-helix repeat-containing protein [Fictibacillus sp. S7]RXZ01670.1 hypothetical protein DMO16_19595 [Fictibacillus sp. S7]